MGLGLGKEGEAGGRERCSRRRRSGTGIMAAAGWGGGGGGAAAAARVRGGGGGAVAATAWVQEWRRGIRVGEALGQMGESYGPHMSAKNFTVRRGFATRVGY